MADWWTLVIVLFLAGLAGVAYSLGALTRAGAFASFVMGLMVALSGGMGWLLLMASFSVIGVVATRFGYADKETRKVAEGGGGERRTANVIANGAAATLAALALHLDIIPVQAAALAFATAVAAVTADTLASELGSLQQRARLVIPPFRLARAGENGAVSWAGQAAALGGAALIGALAIPLLELYRVAPGLYWVPAVAGFLGCQLDSLLGATLERDQYRDGILSKQDVNFLASAVPGFVVLVIVSLL